MRSMTLALLVSTSLVFAAPLSSPVRAETDLGNVVTGIAQTLVQSELDKQAYLEAQSLNTPEGYQIYLKKYPNGLYKGRAQAQLAAMGYPVKGTLASDVQIERELMISASQRVAIQRELAAQGFLRGSADGIWGNITRSAIASWQKAQDARANGYLTQPKFTKLSKSAALRLPVVVDTNSAAVNNGAPQVEANIGLTRTQRADVQRSLTLLGHNAGVADGLWGVKTRNAIASWQRANAKAVTGYTTAAQVEAILKQAGKIAPTVDVQADAAMQEQLLSLTDAERRDIQIRLSTMGYNTRGADGVFGPNTRFAIRSWQADYSRKVSGYLTPEDVRLLYKQSVA